MEKEGFNELKNNMGDVLKAYAENSKEGKKLQRQKEILDEAKLTLKSLDLNDTLDVAREKVLSMLTKMYTRHHLEKQVSYLNNKRTTQEVISQAYYTVLGKQEQYEKAVEKMKREFEGEL